MMDPHHLTWRYVKKWIFSNLIWPKENDSTDEPFWNLSAPVMTYVYIWLTLVTPRPSHKSRRYIARLSGEREISSFIFLVRKNGRTNKKKIFPTNLMESQVTLDGVCGEEDFSVAGQNQQESIESLEKEKKNFKKLLLKFQRKKNK